MMDTQKFLAHAIEIARAILPFCDGDLHQACHSALQMAHVNLGQEQFFRAVDALGGDEEARSAIEAVLHE